MINHDKLVRLLLIVRKLKSLKHGHIDSKDLLSYINKDLDFRDFNTVSRRTLERDLADLRDRPFYLDIQHVKGMGYHLVESEHRDIDIEQLLEPFDILTALNADTGLSNYILTEKYTNKGTDFVYILLKAIRESLRISFDYSKYLDNNFSNRTLEPYAIKLYKGQWYVVGKSETSDEIKTFGLDRISNLNILSQKFKKDNSVDLNEKFKYSFGIYSSDEYPIENVILSFNLEDGSYLKTVPLHSSQEIVNQTKDEIIIKLRLRITEDFVMALLSRSWSLKVIEPSSLRQRVYEIYKSALERNL